jgi:outer membrane protein assembly factor BamB
VRVAAVALVLCTLLGVASARAVPAAKEGGSWTTYGYNAERTNVGPARTGITAANVSKLVRQQIQLDGTVDSSPIYVRAAKVGGGLHDAFFVQTTYGLAYAIEADTGGVLWRFTPNGYASYAGTYRFTSASPALDPDGQSLYTESPDGLVHKLDLATGTEDQNGAWPVPVTLDPLHEKLTAPPNISGPYLVATTSSYGDAPPYQGHLVTIDRQSGKIAHVWNSLCSNRHELMDPKTCQIGAEVVSGGSIWARSGAVRQPGTGNLLVATANGEFDGHTLWSTSVVMLSPDGSRILKYFAPANWRKLTALDQDLASTAPALITRNLLLQGGKDGKLRLIDLRRMRSPSSAGRNPVLGTAVQIIDAPGSGLVFTTPAVWTHKGVKRVFVATGKGLTAYVLRHERLRRVWRKTIGGTSPVLAGGLLYVYDPRAGALNVYVPTTGKRVGRLPAGRGHWNTPIVTDGRIALGQEDANAQDTSGVLNIYRLGRR